CTSEDVEQTNALDSW
nr:immunoglobulin heavy chain junction region [Macaca mulatta]MOY23539.1 immunoglobulin heavy chain junction region [Macaca mulatta]